MKQKLVAFMLIGLSGQAIADNVLHNSAGETVRNGDGECVIAKWGFEHSDCDVKAPTQLPVKAVTLPVKVEPKVVELVPAPAVEVTPLPGEGVELTDEVAKVVQPPFMHDSVYFDTDKDVLTQASQATLNTLIEKADVMNVNGLVVQGFADVRGTEAYNKALSERRNQAVINYLHPTFKQVEVIQIPMGETQMWSAQDMQENRRVNVYLTGTMK